MDLRDLERYGVHPEEMIALMRVNRKAPSPDNIGLSSEEHVIPLGRKFAAFTPTAFMTEHHNTGAAPKLDALIGFFRFPEMGMEDRLIHLYPYLAILDDFGYSKEDHAVLRFELDRLATQVLAEGDSGWAGTAFRVTGNTEGLIQTFDFAIKGDHSLYDAAKCAYALQDEHSICRVLDRIREDDPHLFLMATELEDDYIQLVAEYAASKGFRYGRGDRMIGTLRAAHQLMPQYDVGIGIAKAGLTPAAMFDLFGLPIYVCECHKQDEDTTFDWIDEPDIYGKKVLILENDIVTGRTLTRVVQEIERYDPKQVDIFLDTPTNLVHNDISNAPPGIGTIHHPETLNMENLSAAYLEFKKRYAERSTL
ncbi:phosphoribosyltransferase [Nanoarchaeota archaeon]